MATSATRPPPLPQGFREYGVGELQALPTPRMVAALGLKTGVVSSGNSLDYTAEDMERMLGAGAAVKVRIRRVSSAVGGGV